MASVAPAVNTSGPSTRKNSRMRYDDDDHNPKKKPPYRLTFADATEVWRLRWDGFFQHQIAARFGVNQARVNDVLKARLHSGSESAARA